MHQVKTAKDIALYIKQSRKAKGLTQQQLADKIGVSRSWIIDLEKGKPTIALDLVLKVLNGLCIKISFVAINENINEAINSLLKNPVATNIDQVTKHKQTDVDNLCTVMEPKINNFHNQPEDKLKTQAADLLNLIKQHKLNK